MDAGEFRRSTHLYLLKGIRRIFLARLLETFAAGLGACHIKLPSPTLSSLPSSTSLSLARVTFIGGYVLPGESRVGVPPATPDLPSDLEQAAVEQVAFWFRNRDKTGLIRSWPHDGTYESFLQSDLLLDVRAVLEKYQRLAL